MKVGIIGNGLFGSIIARKLRKEGIDVAVFASNSENLPRASECSAGLWKDTWINKAIRQQVVDSYDLLSELIDGSIEEKVMHNKNTQKEETFFHVPPSSILVEANRIGKILKIEDCGESMKLWFHDPKVPSTGLYSCDYVVVAAGAFTDDLLSISGLPTLGVDRYWGKCFFSSEVPTISKLRVWAPYKQSMWFPVNNELSYISDGATVKNPKQDDARITKVTDRLIENLIAIGADPSRVVGTKEGFRPFLSKGIDFVTKVHSRVIVATGGRKNSTVLCGYVAKKAFELLKES